MSRADRWWRPAGQRRNARPAVRSARRARYAADEKYMQGFELGLDIGEAEERKRHRDREDMLLRRDDDDDLLGVADGAGVTPLADVDPAELVDDIEGWLREQ